MDQEDREKVSKVERYSIIKTPKRRRKTFINGQLHHIIHINIPADIITTFNYEQDKIIRYPYRAMKKSMKKAYSIGEVSKIVRRHPDRIRRNIAAGNIKDGHRSGPTGKKFFTDEEIIQIQEFFASVHFGRPRKDGAITPKKQSVTKEEVDAKLGRREVLYVQNDEGEFIPVWRTIEF